MNNIILTEGPVLPDYEFKWLGTDSITRVWRPNNGFYSGLVEDWTNAIQFRKSSKLYRTLVRIDSVGKNTMQLCLPGWDWSKIFSYPKIYIPWSIITQIEKENRIRFHAYINLDCEEIEDLIITNWEE